MGVADLVRAMVSPAASADEGDAALVRMELSRFPEDLLTAWHDVGIGIITCREAVTDYRPDLRGQTPRGWPPGVDWTVVPGCYLPDERKVAIATMVFRGVRCVPPMGVRHSAFNLVLHETMHADDYVADRLRSHNDAFLIARERDKAALTDYQRQDGVAGMEESYAETAARHFGADPLFAGQCPALSRFWTQVSLPVPPGRRRRAGSHGDDSIGTARLLDDGRIELDLRADDEEEAMVVGAHALIAVAPGSQTHDEILRHQHRLLSDQPIFLPPF